MPESDNVGTKLHCSENSQSSPGLASPSVATPSPSDKHNIKKRPNNGIDVNKKPKQRPKMKRHRPKVAIDHIHGQPRKAPKAQTPRPSTPKPKTPKCANLRAKIYSANKSDLKGSASTSENVNAEAVFVSPTCVAVSCKRSLNFDIQEIEHRDDVAKSCSGSLDFNLDNQEKCDFLRKVATSKRGARKKRIYIKNNNHGASENFDKHIIELHPDLNRESRERGENCARRIFYQYHRRKKSVERSSMKAKFGLNMGVEECTSSASNRGKELMVENPHEIETEAVSDSNNLCSTNKNVCLQFYQRKFRVNQCRQNSRKIGPNFPKIWKKSRMRRQKATTFSTMWFLIEAEDGERKVKKAYGRSEQTTGRTLAEKLNCKRVQNGFKKSKYHNPLILGCDFHIEKRFLQMILPTEEQTQAAIADPESFKCVLSLKPVAISRGKRSKGFIRRSIFNSSTMNFNFVQSPPHSLLKDIDSERYGSEVYEPRTEVYEPQTLEEIPLTESEYYTNWKENTMGFFLDEAVAYDSEMKGQLPRETQTLEEVQLTESENCRTVNTVNFFLDDAIAYDNEIKGELLPEHNCLEVAVYEDENYPPQHKDILLTNESKETNSIFTY